MGPTGKEIQSFRSTSPACHLHGTPTWACLSAWGPLFSRERREGNHRQTDTVVALNSSTWLAGETAYDVGESEPSDRGRVILDVLEQKKKQKVLFDLCVSVILA